MFLLILLSIGSLQAPARLPEAEAVEAAKKAVVRHLDPTLPRTTFSAWLRDVSGPTLQTTWEVNDCREQTGNPDVDRGRDIPMCVQAHLTLGNKRDLYLLLVVGTSRKGVTSGPPSFFYGCITEAGAPIKWLKQLGEVPAIVRAAR